MSAPVPKHRFTSHPLNQRQVCRKLYLQLVLNKNFTLGAGAAFVHLYMFLVDRCHSPGEKIVILATKKFQPEHYFFVLKQSLNVFNYIFRSFGLTFYSEIQLTTYLFQEIRSTLESKQSGALFTKQLKQILRFLRNLKH